MNIQHKTLAFDNGKDCLFVTGGSSGIGKATVTQAAKRMQAQITLSKLPGGQALVDDLKPSSLPLQNIVFTYNSGNEKAQKLIEELKASCPDIQIRAIQINFNNPDTIEPAVGKLKDILGNTKINMVVHCAGVGSATVKKLLPEEPTLSQLGETYQRVNATSPMILQLLLEERKLLQTEGDGTSIIGISSVGGGDRQFEEMHPLDAPSKAAFEMGLLSVAQKNIMGPFHVVILRPGATDTPMFQQSTTDKATDKEFFYERLPKGKIFTPEEVATHILHYTPANAQLTHGATISASGGLQIDYKGLPDPSQTRTPHTV